MLVKITKFGPRRYVQLVEAYRDEATTMYFEETTRDQGGETSFEIELGRSSYYREDSIYVTVDGKTVIMDRTTAQRFVNAVVSVGHYHGLLE